MTNQFKYWVQNVTLRPFSGEPSVDYKYQIALALDAASAKYNKPIAILYFGDYDRAGLLIPQSATKDIREWCNTDFEFIRCGLNEGDDVKYNIPENPDHPGTFQWEAMDDSLDDPIAGDLITSSLRNTLI